MVMLMVKSSKMPSHFSKNNKTVIRTEMNFLMPLKMIVSTAHGLMFLDPQVSEN